MKLKLGKGGELVDVGPPRTIRCQAGLRCSFGDWHLSCLGIPLDRQEEIWLGVEWWCQVCRLKFPEEAKGSVLLPGERLKLRGQVDGVLEGDGDNDFGSVPGWSDVSGEGIYGWRAPE